MSYANFLMYGAVIPSFDSGKKDKDGSDDVTLDAHDPENYDKIREYFRSRKKH